MPDMWIAECLACRWEERHDSELGAIEATTNHVFDRHRDVSPELRAEKKIGHVQLRTVPLSSPEQEESAGPSQQESGRGSLEEPAKDEPAGSALPEAIGVSQGPNAGGEREGF